MKSVQTVSKYSPSNPYHVYYNLDMVNNDTTGLSQAVPLSFLEVRNSPYLTSPESYCMSVVRFSLQTPTLPKFLPQVMVGQPDKNKLIYSITLTYKTATYQQYISYISFNRSAREAEPPLTVQDVSSEYYYVMAYQQWIAMVNSAFISAVANLQLVATGLGLGALPSMNPPFMEFNPDNLNYIIDADAIGYDSALTDPIKIYFNSPMQTLFSAFNYINYGYRGITDGKNYQLVIANMNGANLLTLPTYTAIQCYSEFSTCALWNPISKISFTTSLLPVVPENVSLPKIYNSPQNALITGGNNNNISPILTDFEVPFSALNTYCPNITYTPNGEYRMTDLYGDREINGIQLSVFWVDYYGNNYPIQLASGCSANVKLMFRKKAWNASNFQ